MTIQAKLPDGLTKGQRWRKGTGKNYSKEYHQKNREKRNADERERYNKKKEYVSFLHKMWYEENKESSRIQHKEYRRIQRDAAMAGYGSQCLFCGEDRLEGLVFHHVNGDGKEHRKSIGDNLHGWLICNNFPDNVILLCGTCHLILHEAERDDYYS